MKLNGANHRARERATPYAPLQVVDRITGGEEKDIGEGFGGEGFRVRLGYGYQKESVNLLLG